MSSWYGLADNHRHKGLTEFWSCAACFKIHHADCGQCSWCSSPPARTKKVKP